jgi:hypothetical protein
MKRLNEYTAPRIKLIDLYIADIVTASLIVVPEDNDEDNIPGANWRS